MVPFPTSFFEPRPRFIAVEELNSLGIELKKAEPGDSINQFQSSFFSDNFESVYHEDKILCTPGTPNNHS